MGRPFRGRRTLTLLVAAAVLVAAVSYGLWWAIPRPPSAPVIVAPAASDQPLDGLALELLPSRTPSGLLYSALEWELYDLDQQDVLVWSARTPGRWRVELSDGSFQGPQAENRRLNFGAKHRLRVRGQSERGLWSEWAEQRFVTPTTASRPPWRIQGIMSPPLPHWRTEADGPIALPAGARLSVEGAAGASWLQLSAAGTGGELLATPGPLVEQAEQVRLRLSAPPGAAWELPASRLTLIGALVDGAERLTIMLPDLRLAAGSEQLLWVGSTGATFWPGDDPAAFSRERLAREAAVPWELPPGYSVEAVTTALQLPTSLAFVANPGTDPSAPRYYVTELYGRVKVVTNDGRVRPFADRLLNLNPTGAFPGSGEMGVIGICLPPTGHDVYVTMVYRDQADTLRNKLVRLRSNDGLTATAAEDIFLTRPGTGIARAAHQIQQCTFGPDGKIYTTIGDGTEAANALNDRALGGKLLRLNPDGSAPSDNPRFDRANPAAPISYQYAKGFRNAFGQAWRSADGQLYVSDNGPNTDRLIRIRPGASYGWDGSEASMKTEALYLWPESRWAPTGIAFIEGPGAAVFPADWQGRLLVGSSGLVYAPGTMHAGKAIQVFTLEADGQITRPPERLLRYVGEGFSTVIDLKLQPDGLYFTTLFYDQGDGGGTAPGGAIWRLRHSGATAATASTSRGAAPLTVNFTTTSTPRQSQGCRWDFGNGQTSTEANPQQTFRQPGRYLVSLTCAAPTGAAGEQLLLVTVTHPDGSLPAAATTPQPFGQAPTAASVSFRETGTRLEGIFKRFWEANGGLAIFGYPITNVYQERNAETGREVAVQYFERARFEVLAEAPAEVILAPLGVQLNTRRIATDNSFQPLVGGALQSTPDRQVFSETRHSLSGPFLEFWQRAGGRAILGLPISEPFQETSLTDGKPYQVQYFERARLEHHPELAGLGETVRLARLGAQHSVSRPAPRPPGAN